MMTRIFQAFYALLLTFCILNLLDAALGAFMSGTYAPFFPALLRDDPNQRLAGSILTLFLVVDLYATLSDQQRHKQIS